MKKIAPLIVLAMFGVGVFFMVQGMNGIVEKTAPKTQKESNR